MGSAMLCFGFLIVFACELQKPAPPVVACPPVPAWSKDYQAALADEFERLPPNARRAVREHLQLRKQARACKGL